MIVHDIIIIKFDLSWLNVIYFSKKTKTKLRCKFASVEMHLNVTVKVKQK